MNVFFLFVFFVMSKEIEFLRIKLRVVRVGVKDGLKFAWSFFVFRLLHFLKNVYKRFVR